MHSIRMTSKDIHKADIVPLVELNILDRKKAAELLGISIRQLDRIRLRFKIVESYYKAMLHIIYGLKTEEKDVC